MARRSELPGILFLFAAVAALALLLGWWLGPRLRPAPLAEPPKAEAPELRVEELSFDDLAELLQGEGRDPAARAFARDFAAKPRLRRLYTDFLERAAHSRARQEKGPPARDFVRELKAMSEFSELFAKWSKDAAFRSMAERLARKPAVAPMLRQGAGSAAAAADAEGKAGRVFGLYAVDAERQDDPAAIQASSSDAGSGPAAPAAGRMRSDPRIEGHWVHDGAAVDPLAICAKIGSTGPCQQAVLDCRREPSCARRLAGFGGGGGHGGAAASTRTRRADDGGQGAMRLGEPAPK